MAAEKMRVGFKVPRIDFISVTQAEGQVMARLRALTAMAMLDYATKVDGPVVFGRLTTQYSDDNDGANRSFETFATVAPLADMLETMRVWANLQAAKLAGEDFERRPDPAENDRGGRFDEGRYSVYVELIGEIDKIVKPS